VTTLVDALAGRDGVWTATLVGRHDADPAYVDRVERAVDEHGLGDRLSVPGPVPDDELAALLERAHVLAAPSRYESFGMVYLEAMESGVIPIASTAGGASELVDEGAKRAPGRPWGCRRTPACTRDPAGGPVAARVARRRGTRNGQGTSGLGLVDVHRPGVPARDHRGRRRKRRQQRQTARAKADGTTPVLSRAVVTRDRERTAAAPHSRWSPGGPQRPLDRVPERGVSVQTTGVVRSTRPCGSTETLTPGTPLHAAMTEDSAERDAGEHPGTATDSGPDPVDTDAEGTVDAGTVEHIADLARVNLAAGERERFVGQFADILEYFETLDEVPAVEREPELTNVMRPDEVQESLDRAETLRNAPETEDGQFKGPRVS